jgi:hypothetical protein
MSRNTSSHQPYGMSQRRNQDANQEAIEDTIQEAIGDVEINENMMEWKKLNKSRKKSKKAVQSFD